MLRSLLAILTVLVPTIAWAQIDPSPPITLPELNVKLGGGDGNFVDALKVMERHLADRSFFVADRYTIADIALYAYTHVAGEGGFDLAPYPAIETWLARVREQPRHVPITHAEGIS